MAQRAVAEPVFVDKLTKALTRSLRGAEVCHEHVRADRYRFILVWKKFDRMDHPERQRLVWDIAARVLDADEIWNVTMILTLGHKDLPKE